MSNKKIKTVFIGTSDFGIPAFKALMNCDKFTILGVITQPDKKIGRKQVLTPPPIKAIALKYDLPVWQPKKIAEFEFPDLAIDLIVETAYAQILTKNMLDIPKYGAINIHGSLLPKYRGASCIQAAILNGENQSGITYMKMDEGLDTGPIIARKKIKIEPIDTAGSLHEKLSRLGGEYIVPTLLDYINGKIKPQPQDKSMASYVKKLNKKNGHIDFTKPALEIDKFIRAMYPWPGAFAHISIGNSRQKTIKILKVVDKNIKINKYKSGEIFLYQKMPAVQCGQDALIIEKLQIAGKQKISGQDFIKGYFKLIGAILS